MADNLEPTTPTGTPVPAPTPIPAATPAASAFQSTDNIVLRALGLTPPQVSSSLPLAEPQPNPIAPTETAIPAPVIATEPPATVIPDSSSDSLEPKEIPAEQWASVVIGENAPPLETPTDTPPSTDEFDYTGSGLEADAPAWQKELYQKIKQDASMTDEDKNAVLALPPSKWQSAKRWQGASKTLGRFRDVNVPIEEVVTMLDRESVERGLALRDYALTEIIQNPERAEQFVSANPKQFAQLVSELFKANPDFTKSVLQHSGYSVVESTPADSSTVLRDLQSNPLWAVIQGTELEQVLTDKLSQIQPPKVDEPVGNEPDTSAQNTQALYQKAQETYTNVLNQTWKEQVKDGLRSEGIVPPSQEEYRANPAAAHLKNIVYNVALNGLDGVLPDWDSDSMTLGSKDEGIKGLFEELQTSLTRNEFDKFADNAPLLNEFYYEYGKKRSKLMLIQNLYKMVDTMVKATPTPAPIIPTVPVPNSIGNPAPIEQPKGRFATTDAIVLKNILNGQS